MLFYIWSMLPEIQKSRRFPGRWPLVVGREKTCRCGRLVCPECNRCTADCEDGKRRKREQERAHSGMGNPNGSLEYENDPGYFRSLAEMASAYNVRGEPDYRYPNCALPNDGDMGARWAEFPDT